MLCELKIENLALIESLHLFFDTEDAAGLVVMTGETGAGKSIMLRAIKMLAGERASSDWIRSGADQCVVEAVFSVNPKHHALRASLHEAGIEDDSVLIIKRVLLENGKSRMYINGSPATVKMARDISANLLNVAGQHDQQQLLQPQIHLDFIDTYGDHWTDRDEVKRCYSVYQEKYSELCELKKQEQDKEQKRDFLSFQLDEIRTAALRIGEDEALNLEKKRLKGADSLIHLSMDSYGDMSRVMDDLSKIRIHMEQVLEHDKQATTLVEDIHNFFFTGEDLCTRLRAYADSLENDPFRLDQVTERIDLIQKIKRKYGQSIEEVLAFADAAEKELDRLENIEIRTASLELEVDVCAEELCTKAQALSEKRKQTAVRIAQAMAEELADLAFNQAALEVRWQETEAGSTSVEAIGPSGKDRVEFYFSANPGEPAKPLAKVASGGELSRLMLALKCLLARKDMIETVIFDEVDAGIGGEAAEAVARKIRELATHHQVFCITHLPQIAARGTDHYRVQKEVIEGRTLSSIVMLGDAEREDEVARMLAGDSATAQTHAWAKELLEKSRAEWCSV